MGKDGGLASAGRAPEWGTRLTFVETYHAINPLSRRLSSTECTNTSHANNKNLYQTLLGYLGPVTAVPGPGRLEGA